MPRDTYFKRQLGKMSQKEYERLTGHSYDAINAWANGRVQMTEANAIEAASILGGDPSRYREDADTAEITRLRAENAALKAQYAALEKIHKESQRQREPS